MLYFVASSDYESFSADLTFSKSTSRHEYNVTLINDVMTEGREVFLVRLDEVIPSSGIMITSSMTDITIIDDDSKNKNRNKFHDI